MAKSHARFRPGPTSENRPGGATTAPPGWLRPYETATPLRNQLQQRAVGLIRLSEGGHAALRQDLELRQIGGFLRDVRVPDLAFGTDVVCHLRGRQGDRVLEAVLQLT